MEFGGREIMIVLGVLVFIAIVLDVIRRLRQARYEKIRMPRRKQPIFDDDAEFDDYGSELPSGGARVVKQRDDSDIEELSRSLKEVAEASKPKLNIPVRQAPEFVRAEQEDDLGEHPGEAIEVEEAAADLEQEEQGSHHQSESQGGVLVLHLMARKNKPFEGEPLLRAILRAGLHYGSMKIFHGREGGDESGEVLFSVANSVNPGIFDLKEIMELTSPGVSLFFSLDDVDNPDEAFEEMLATAQQMAGDLDGDLCDEDRSSLTGQTVEYYRERIARFMAARRAGVS